MDKNFISFIDFTNLNDEDKYKLLILRENKIDKATKKADELRKYIYRELVDFNVCGSTEAHCLAKDLLDILKEAENVENN